MKHTRSNKTQPTMLSKTTRCTPCTAHKTLHTTKMQHKDTLHTMRSTHDPLCSRVSPQQLQRTAAVERPRVTFCSCLSYNLKTYGTTRKVKSKLRLSAELSYYFLSFAAHNICSAKSYLAPNLKKKKIRWETEGMQK